MFHMKRRDFLSFCVVTSGWLFASPHTPPPPPHLCKTLQKVQLHIAPPLTSQRLNPTDFLIQTLFHPTYDKDIRAFVIEGAMALYDLHGEGLFGYSPPQMEKILRTYEQEPQGSKWLGRMMILTLEAMLGDPIYGGNLGGEVWRGLGEPPPNPQPKVQYLYG